jgi:hypothetical protein
MGTRLIVLGLLVVTDAKVLSGLIGLPGRAAASQETAPAYRPYPKPTQVDW